ncbi:hypothetical protein HYDPIDRAFT_95146 [Hydnomerulius pinastri MD-312]|uniref:Unplaced genomic scaffold scaffold_23, whole genome shotgun sequence n=1 Tax=Hydnomerulius pinastri MD-312 TaxID=994086 RepID=A0A0C9VVH9_9AGAM|nr:hypothetical protein HYDPIDRAFT_95146 [Hydnomerulius pinastri MD-312]
MASSYAPNESSSSIFAEETWLQGALLSCIFFGIEITLAAMSFYSIFKQMGRSNRRRNISFLVFIFMLFALTTAAQGLSAQFIQMGFITNRDYPGGPSQFFSGEYSTPSNLASTILLVCANWLMECLLVWRCKVICSSSEGLLWPIMIVPCLLLIGTFVTGSLFLHHIIHSAPPTNYTLAYSGTSLILNVTATAIIAGRLLMHRRRVTKLFGPGHGSHYSSIAAMIIESASLYSGFLLLVIVPFAINSSVSNIFQQLIAQVQSISSLLIIFRIAQGKGWTAATGKAIASSQLNTLTSRGAMPGRHENDYHLQLKAISADSQEAFIQKKVDEALARLNSSSEVVREDSAV